MSFDFERFVELPVWSDELRRLYCVLRVEARMGAKRRRYYRLVEKEKLRLAELGVSQIKIAAVCRYLANFKSYKTLNRVLAEIEPQMSINFCAS